MNSYALPQSANWVNHSLAVNSTGSICVYASKLNIVVIKNAANSNVYDFDINVIQRAHKSRVSGIVFCQFVKEGDAFEYFASCGEDNQIHVWDPQTLDLIYVCNPPNLGNKMVDLDVFQHVGVVVGVCDNGSIVKYNMITNKVSVYDVGIKKSGINCISACPHDSNLVAFGADYGLVVVYSLKDDGKLIHKIRPHNFNVLSLSWCPVPYNVLQLENLKNEPNFDEENWKQSDGSMLLASCSVDRTIYICKAGTNAYCEAIISLPPKPLRYLPKSNFCAQNYEKICRITWAQPLLLLATTEFSELVSVTFKTDVPAINQQNLKKRKGQPNRMVNYDINLLHSQHRRFISCLNIPYAHNSDIIPVWTVSLDKIIIRYSYGSKQSKTLLSLPTISGPVYCLAFSPVNPDMLAIGTGESKIYIWYVTAKNHLDLMVLTKKIQDKVMSIAWHPVYEGLLAFGTTGGRIGIFDISQGQNFPTLLKLYHSRPIYKLVWVPCDVGGCSDGDKYNLWALGNGDVLQYDIENPNQLPIDMKGCFGETDVNDKCTPKTEMCYDTDSKLFVFGLDDGRLFVATKDTDYRMRDVIWDQRRAVMSMAFHPNVVTASPKEVSPCKNWLAVGGENVIIYDVDPDCKKAPQKIAFHDIHLERVTEVCWSPHVNGRLLSVSFDFTAVIWNAVSQTVIASCHLHNAAIFCCAWHPFDQNLVVTGSHDGTCRVWNVFKDTVDEVPSKEEIKQKIKIRRKPKMPVCMKEPTKQLTAQVADPSISCNVNSVVSGVKKVQLRTLFPTFGKDFQKCSDLDLVIQNTINDYISSPNDDNDRLNGVAEKVIVNGMKEEESSHMLLDQASATAKEIGSGVTYANLFGTDDELDALINVEKSELASSVVANSFVLTQSQFKLKETILDAMQKNEVTEYMLSLAPSISPKLWKDACNVYVEQLINSDHILQAVNFLMALNKHKEAISLLFEKRYYKEAFLICRQCLKDETEVKDAACKLAKCSATTGFSRLAAHAYMFIGDHSAAANTLIRSKCITDVSLGIKLMYHIDATRTTELSVDCFRKLIVSHAWNDIADLLQQVNAIKYLEPWYLVAKYLHEKKLSTHVIGDWFLGNVDGGDSTLKSLKQMIANSDNDFHKLERSVPDNKFNMDGKQLLMHTSGRVALFLIGWKEECKRADALRHLLKALSYCYNYRIMNASTKRNVFYPLLQILMMIFAKGPRKIDETFGDDELSKEQLCAADLLMKSVLAYLGDCVICWLIHFKDASSNSAVDDEGDSQTSSKDGGDHRQHYSPQSDNESTNSSGKTDATWKNSSETVVAGDEEDKLESKYKSLMSNRVKLIELDGLFDKFLNYICSINNIMYYQSTSVLKSIEMHLSKNRDINDVLKDYIRTIDFINDHYDDNKRENNSDLIEQRNPINNNGFPSEKDENDDEIIKEIPSAALDDNVKPHLKNLLRYAMEFEEKYASCPNPMYFYCDIQNFLTAINDIINGAADDDEVRLIKEKLSNEITTLTSKFDFHL